jgi:hypothetical protein
MLELYNTGLGYSSINTARSALSLFLSPIEGHSVGDHPIVTRFVKGVGKLRPSFPRYDDTWDVDILLKYFTDLPCNKDLSLSLYCIVLYLWGSILLEAAQATLFRTHCRTTPGFLFILG